MVTEHPNYLQRCGLLYKLCKTRVFQPGKLRNVHLPGMEMGGGFAVKRFWVAEMRNISYVLGWETKYTLLSQ